MDKELRKNSKQRFLQIFEDQTTKPLPAKVIASVMVKCSLMTFSFAIIFLFSNPLFLDMDTSALSRIVEEHLDNYHDFVTHLTEIMRGLHARNIYVYFHGNQRRSQLLHQTITLVNHCEISPVIVAQYDHLKFAILSKLWRY